MKLMDAHVFIIPKGQYEHIGNDRAEVEEMFADTDGIVLMYGIKQHDDCFAINEEFFKIIKGMEDIYPFVWLHPVEKEKIEKFLIDKTIYGLKTHPSISQCKISDPKFDGLFEVAEKHNYPVLVHSGRAEISRFKHIVEAAGKYKNPFITAHLGGMATELIMDTLTMIEKENIMEKYPNIYFDTACIYNPKTIKLAVKTIGVDRLIFGSDEPFHDYKAQRANVLMCLEDMGYSESDIEKIMYSNIKGLIDGVKK